MRSASSDGTTIRTRTHIEGVVDEKKFSRSGYESHEFLVSNELFRTIDAAGVVRTAAALHDPVPMEHGKTVPLQFMVCRRH